MVVDRWRQTDRRGRCVSDNTLLFRTEIMPNLAKRRGRWREGSGYARPIHDHRTVENSLNRPKPSQNDGAVRPTISTTSADSRRFSIIARRP